MIDKVLWTPGHLGPTQNTSEELTFRPAEANTGNAFSWAFLSAQYIPFIPQLLIPGIC